MHNTLYEMRSLAYSVPLSVPRVFWKFEVRERLELKIGGEEPRSFASYGTLTTAASKCFMRVK